MATPPSNQGDILSELVKNARLTWRLLTDGRVSPGLKAIPVATLLYVLSPIDLFPDVILGLGQLDDIGAILLGLMLFIKMCPPEVVRQHLQALVSGPGASQVQSGKAGDKGYVIDAPYHIIEDDQEG
jgi:uncharacterized membrane protein YkvA (DUF1232 family)